VVGPDEVEQGPEVVAGVHEDGGQQVVRDHQQPAEVQAQKGRDGRVGRREWMTQSEQGTRNQERSERAQPIGQGDLDDAPEQGFLCFLIPP